MATYVFLLWALLLSVAGLTAGVIKEWSIVDLQKKIPAAPFGGINSVEEVPLLDPPYHAAGYIHPNNTEEAKLFYFYFQERSKDPDAPLLFWTNGGPGCSSLFGLFTENGPYVIEKDLTLKWREFGWDVGQNILFVEQPVGTGFSYSEDEDDHVHYETGVGADMLMFFIEFLEIHPELKGKDFFLSGESYAGHYLPGIADSIHKNSDLLDLNLKGVLMGNPWTDPLAVSLSYPNFAEAHGLITKELADEIRGQEDECISLYEECQATKDFITCYIAALTCDSINWDPVLEENPDINVYDIRKKCVGGDLCYDNHLLADFLNDPEVQEILGVNKTWVECDDAVYEDMAGDMMINMGPTVQHLLDHGIRFIVYVGDQDLICNWMGNKEWLDNMAWEKSSKWKGKLSDWGFTSKSGKKVDAGECEVLEPLTFCTVFQAGHMVPTDQPEPAFDMLQRFIKGERFVESDAPTLQRQDAFFRKQKFAAT